MTEHISKFRDDKDRIWCVCYTRTPGIQATADWSRFKGPDDPDDIEIEWIEVRLRNGREIQVCQDVAERYINLEELG